MEGRDNYLNLNDLENEKIYIDDDMCLKEDLDESSLKISWIDSVEKELSSSIDTKTFLSKSGNRKMDIDELINYNYDDLSDISILEYQTIILNGLKKEMKMIQIEDLKINDILMKIDWILETSKSLSEKVGLPIFEHKMINKNAILRSSYKFCNFNFECQYNYDVKKHSGCFAQHYVHNLVYADLDSLKKYILNGMPDNINIEEIRKSINTIAFVATHMYEELKNAQKFNFFNTKNSHVERKPNKKKNKGKLVSA